MSDLLYALNTTVSKQKTNYTEATKNAEATIRLLAKSLEKVGLPTDRFGFASPKPLEDGYACPPLQNLLAERNATFATTLTIQVAVLFVFNLRLTPTARGGVRLVLIGRGDVSCELADTDEHGDAPVRLPEFIKAAYKVAEQCLIDNPRRATEQSVTVNEYKLD